MTQLTGRGRAALLALALLVIVLTAGLALVGPGILGRHQGKAETVTARDRPGGSAGSPDLDEENGSQGEYRPSTGHGGEADTSVHGESGGSGEQVSVGELADLCAEMGGDARGGAVPVAGSLAIHGNGSIDVPCKLQLEPGASVAFRGARIESSMLGIVDAMNGLEDEANGPTSVLIEGSELRGTTGAAFVISLADADDSVTVRGSVIDYGASVAMSVMPGLSGAGSAATIEVAESELSSTSYDSQGMWFAAGDIRMRNVRFDSAEGRVVVMAERCDVSNVSPSSVKCMTEP